MMRKINKWCVLGVLTSISSIFASGIGFLRIFLYITLNFSSRALFYVSLTLICYDCSINTVCVYFNFDFTYYYHEFCCAILEHRIVGGLCQWWIVKNVEKLQKECRAFDGNLPQNIDVGCCDVFYGKITKQICYRLCCHEKLNLIRHYSKSRTMSVFESPAGINIHNHINNNNHSTNNTQGNLKMTQNDSRILVQSHSENGNDIAFQSSVDYEILRDH